MSPSPNCVWLLGLLFKSHVGGRMMAPVPRTFAFNFGVSNHSLWERGGNKCRHMKSIHCYGGVGEGGGKRR